MKRSDEQLLFGLGLVWLLGKLDNPLKQTVTYIEKGGARLFELSHPYEQGHVIDLPGKQWTRAQLVELARRTGFPDPRLAAAVALAESGGVPNALQSTDREFSVGLWQINLRAHPEYSREQMADPERNAAAAFAISHGGRSWQPWTTYNTGAYRRYL